MFINIFVLGNTPRNASYDADNMMDKFNDLSIKDAPKKNRKPDMERYVPRIVAQNKRTDSENGASRSLRRDNYSQEREIIGDNDRNSFGHANGNDRRFDYHSHDTRFESHANDKRFESHRNDRRYDSHSNDRKYDSHPNDRKYDSHPKEKRFESHHNDKRFDSHPNDRFNSNKSKRYSSNRRRGSEQKDYNDEWCDRNNQSRKVLYFY